MVTVTFQTLFERDNHPHRNSIACGLVTTSVSLCAASGYTPRLVTGGAWCPWHVRHGPWHVRHGPWHVRHGPWHVRHGPWHVRHGPQHERHGLWACGMCATASGYTLRLFTAAARTRIGGVTYRS